MKKVLSLLGVNGAAAVLLIVLLSPGLFNLFAQPVLVVLLGLIVGFAALLGCLWIDYRLLFRPEPAKRVPQQEPPASRETRAQEYTRRLKNCLHMSFFQKDLTAAIDQIARFEKKQQTVHEMLQGEGGEKVGAGRCLAILQSVGDIFYENVRSLLARTRLFDEKEYQLFRNGQLELSTPQARAQKEEFYRTLAQSIDEMTDQNEEILLQIDKLSLELSRASTSNQWDTDTIVAMKRLDDYIQSTRQAQNWEREAGETVCRQIKR